MSPQPAPAIRSASRSAHIAAALQADILGGRYREGERLPSERELAARFAASRGSVREALKQLEQLGIASIQPGGVRVAPITECTLDVLGPLLDSTEVPDPALADQVMGMFGELLRIAARDALATASPADMANIRQLAAALLAPPDADRLRHDALRALVSYLVDVADNLVLRLMLNGLRLSFMSRLTRAGIQYDLDSELYKQIAGEIKAALDADDHAQFGECLLQLNRYFRDNVRAALGDRTVTRIHT